MTKTRQVHRPQWLIWAKPPATPDAGMEEMREMNERVVRRSPATSADEPAHRQTRRSPAPDQQRRRGDGPRRSPVKQRA